MPPCNSGNVGSRRKRLGQDLQPLLVAPAPTPLRSRKYCDLPHPPLQSAQIRAHLRSVVHLPRKAVPAGKIRPPTRTPRSPGDRKSVGEGKGGAVMVNSGG